ncbi:MAG: prephenate dehydratase [Brevinematia bacterium]
MAEEISKIRKEIDQIDRKIVELLDQRAEFVKKIGEYKKQNNIPIYQPDREREVKELVLATSKNIFPKEALLQIFTEIVSAARSLEEPITVGYLGPEGTFTEMAVNKHFGSSVIKKPLPSIPDVFREVENGKLDFGVVPIENSLEGTVNITLDEFIDSPLKVVGEVFINVHHNLMANVTSISEIKRVYSHPQTFAQCRIWLETNMPNVEKIEVSSNAKAASMVPWDKFSAAIGGRIAAEKYGLNIIAENIEDSPENYTRFWAISTNEHKLEKAEKTTLLVSVKDKPGALLRILEPFHQMNLNLSKIESRPSRRRPWDYIFFIDVEGSVNSEDFKKAIEIVKENSVFLKILGSYAKGNY